jgi:enoyl-CoA hydratase/carnithine racemase
MKDKSFADAYKSNFLGSWGRVTGMRKPIVGAVAGYAVGPSLFSLGSSIRAESAVDAYHSWFSFLCVVFSLSFFPGLVFLVFFSLSFSFLPSSGQLGGGCELAMMCDILLCSPTATFGQPEINLGIIPGAGGTQRLTKIVGKPVAMDMVLTGRRIGADEAERCGLVSRVVREGSVVDKAVEVAEEVARLGRVAVQAGKEAVNAGE